MEDLELISRGCSRFPRVYDKGEGYFKHGCNKLDVFDWLHDIEKISQTIINKDEFVEVRFKNSRKDIFKVPENMDLRVGSIIAVEALPGHDIGIISLTGPLVRLQMKKKRINPDSENIKRVYRKARPLDLEKWHQAIALETATMFKSRKIAANLKLAMKICDVEYQGDGTKAIFYYTADERVDFRELIKILAEEFSIRIEMRQIGARQEASRLGGIGACGRELCCSTWLTNYYSVSTNAARIQQLSINPQKIAGQCAKLKCCLSYEYDHYVEALKEFPNTEINLKTKKGTLIHQKTDIFKKILWYAYQHELNVLIPASIEEIKKIIEANKKNIIPNDIEPIEQKQKVIVDYGLEDKPDHNITRLDDITNSY